MPRDAVSRTANVERTDRHKWVKLYCMEGQPTEPKVVHVVNACNMTGTEVQCRIFDILLGYSEKFACSLQITHMYVSYNLCLVP